MLNEKKFPITSKILKKIKGIAKNAIDLNVSHTKVNGLNVTVRNGEMWVNGKKVDIPQGTKVKTAMPQNMTGGIKVKDGETKIIEGDVLGNLTLQGNNITLIIEGDCLGNVYGASSVTVKGDMMGNC